MKKECEGVEFEVMENYGKTDCEWINNGKWLFLFVSF